MMRRGSLHIGLVVAAATIMLGVSPSLASINQQFFLSENNKLYFVVVSNPSAGSVGAQMTSLMMTSGSALPVNETANNPPDPVVTSFAHSLSGQILRFPPLSNLKRTALITGLTSNNIQNPNPCNPLVGCFDPAANGGSGLLTLPGGAGTVAFDNSGTIPIQDITAPSGAGNTLVPAATTTTITRRVGSTTFTTPTIVFPNPPGAVVTSQGSTCTVALVCTGAGPVCSPTNGNADCPAGQTCTCFGGETPGQNVTLDDTLMSRIGNPASQVGVVDGIFLPNTTAMMVFLVDDGASSFGLTADGFAVTGTCSNDANVACDEPADCPGGTCTDALSSRNNVNTTGDIDNQDFNTPTVTSTFTPSNTPTLTPTNTATNTATPTSTPSSTLTPSNTPTLTQTNTVTPTFTPSPTRTNTATQTPTRPPIPVVPSPISPAGLVMVGSLAVGMLWALRRLMASR